MDKRRSGFAALSVIMSLLTIALIALIAIILLRGPQGSSGSGAESPIQRAKNVHCLAQIKKIEMEVQLYCVQHGKYPASLGMLGGLEESDFQCPVTGTGYEYDPHSGRISCPDHIR